MQSQRAETTEATGATACNGCSEVSSPSDLCLWACGHRRCLNCVWSGVTKGDPDRLMLRCASCSRRQSSAATVEAAKTELDQLLREHTVADTLVAPDWALCFTELDDEASREVRSVALQAGLFVQEGSDDKTVCFQVRTLSD